MLLRKFGLVMWKNLLLRKRHWIITSCEIVIPVALFILAAVTQSQLKSSDDNPSDVNHVAPEYFPIKKEDNVTSYINLMCNTTVLYAPNNNFTSCIMGSVTSNGSVFFGK